MCSFLMKLKASSHRAFQNGRWWFISIPDTNPPMFTAIINKLSSFLLFKCNLRLVEWALLYLVFWGFFCLFCFFGVEERGQSEGFHLSFVEDRDTGYWFRECGSYLAGRSITPTNQRADLNIRLQGVCSFQVKSTHRGTLHIWFLLGRTCTLSAENIRSCTSVWFHRIFPAV